MDYEIIYSKRKTLSLQVYPDLRIVVRSPIGLKKDFIVKFVNDHKDWIEERLQKHRSNPINPYSFDKEEINTLKSKTKEIVLPMVEYYSNIMNLCPNKISISSAKRLFGSCNDKGNLSFSFRLCLYPREAIEYVVVHELSHMKELNHSKNFWTMVEKYLPDYKERKKLLK